MFVETVERAAELLTAIINSPFRGILLSVVTIATLLIVKSISGYFVKKYVYQHAQVETNAQNFMAVWGYIWTAIIAIFGIISLSGSLKTLGISAGFLGMVLGWSLQAPVTGIAAWLMLILIRLTYHSDIRRAEQIMCEQAAETTADICTETGESPYVRFEFIASGVVAKLRYRVEAVRRQSTSTLIVERISEALTREEGIDFAYVKREALLVPQGEQLPPPQYLRTEQFREHSTQTG